MVELISSGRIWSVPFGTRDRRLKPRRLPNGAILQPASVLNVPIPAYFEVDDHDQPVVNFDDVNDDQKTAFIELTGTFILPDGRPGAVYGATANPIG